MRGIAQLQPEARARARVVANWREKLARERDLPRSWILGDAAVFAIAQADPKSLVDLDATLLEALNASGAELTDVEPVQDLRPTAAQKALLERLIKTVDARAAELQVSAEVLAPRGELKALAMGKRDTHALTGWRREEIGTRLLESLL